MRITTWICFSATKHSRVLIIMPQYISKCKFGFWKFVRSSVKPPITCLGSEDLVAALKELLKWPGNLDDEEIKSISDNVTLNCRLIDLQPHTMMWRTIFWLDHTRLKFSKKPGKNREAIVRNRPAGQTGLTSKEAGHGISLKLLTRLFAMYISLLFSQRGHKWMSTSN
ncbi:hypothetical protein SDJN02_20864, partial [Cucurbita argyrosperma subsp. argyrosperma]